MKRGLNKGLSTIVSTLLILLLVFVAIGLLWVVIRNVLESGTEQVALGKLTLDLEIENVEVSGSNLDVRVKRNPGEGTFTGLSFVLSEGGDSEVIEITNVSMDEYSVQTFSLDVSSVGMIAGNIQSVEVAPIFTLDSGKEVTGDVKSSYTLTPSGTGTIVNCGNGLIDAGEDCDGTNISSNDSCITEGYDGGTLACASDCSFDVSGCTLVTCPNGVIDSGEQCDCGSDGVCTSAELDDETCSSYLGMGYSGSLGCYSSTTCQFDVSGCTYSPVCGDGVNETGEECDDGDSDDGDGCSATCNVESGWTCSGGSGQSVCTAISTYWQTGMVSWWNFESDATDSIGSNNGTVNGATHITSGCAFGNGCYSFDGVDDYIEVSVPVDSSLDIKESAMSISGLFSVDVFGNPQVLLGKPVSSSQHMTPYFAYGVHVYSTYYRPYFSTNVSQYNTLYTSGGTVLNESIWYHFIVVYDNGQLCTYLDGVLYGSCASVAAGSTIHSYNTPLRIGTNGGLTENFGGSMDEIMIWDRALNSTEIADIFSYFAS